MRTEDCVVLLYELVDDECGILLENTQERHRKTRKAIAMILCFEMAILKSQLSLDRNHSLCQEHRGSRATPNVSSQIYESALKEKEARPSGTHERRDASLGGESQRHLE